MSDLNLPKGLVVKGYTNLKDFVEVDKLALADYLLSIKNINTGAGGKVNLQNLIKSINSTSDKNLIVQGDDGKLLVSKELFKTINDVSILGSGDVFTPSQKGAINSGVSTNTVSQVETNRANISELDGRMTTAESDINVIKGRTTTAENDVDSLETRMTTAEDNINKKQDILVSGTNIKTINGNSIVGSGDIELSSAGGGGGLPIGTIIPVNATSNYVPDGSLPCDGAEYTKSQFTDLWNNYLSTNLLNTCTYTEYQQDIATYGQCGKFAVDTTNNKFRVPLIKDGAVIQQALTDDKLGKSYNAGLPNITGNANIQAGKAGGWNWASNITGCFYSDTSKTLYLNNGTGAVANWLNLDASRSSDIYGNSDTVQPNAVALRYFVVVANGQINQSIMDWSAWSSSLQGKANTDLSNLSDSGKKVIDGQWVGKHKILITETSAGTYARNVSSYLPSDSYTYEVLLLVSYNEDATKQYMVYSDIIPSHTAALQVSGGGTNNGSYLLLPIGSERKVYLYLSGNMNLINGCGLQALGYRRIGTNS